MFVQLNLHGRMFVHFDCVNVMSAYHTRSHQDNRYSNVGIDCRHGDAQMHPNDTGGCSVGRAIRTFL